MGLDDMIALGTIYMQDEYLLFWYMLNAPIVHIRCMGSGIANIEMDICMQNVYHSGWGMSKCGNFFVQWKKATEFSAFSALKASNDD